MLRNPTIQPPVPLKHGVQARYKLRRVKASTGIIVEETPWFSNLCVNQFFDDRLSGSEYFYKGFIVGAGTATPLETDTALQSYIGGGASVQEVWTTRNSTVSPRSITYGVRIRSDEGACAGNVSEVAMYADTVSNSPSAPTSGRRIHSRARIRDEFGNPTTIAVLSDEYLDALYELTVFAIEGATGTLVVNVNGVPTNFPYTLRSVCMANTSAHAPANSIANMSAAMVTSFLPSGYGSRIYNSVRVAGNTSLLTYESSVAPPSAVSNLFVAPSFSTYTPGSKTRTFTQRLALANGNIAGGVPSIFIGLDRATGSNSWQQYQMLFDTPIPKVADRVFDLPITITLANAGP